MLNSAQKRKLDVEASGNANIDGLFSHNEVNNHYIYNLSTSGYESGTYRVSATAENGESQSVNFSLR